ncbi:unnamed protein product [Cyclocybe aegerita]|uniref:F-box domain-containing protein n=1 Tax=Cyclocybe aegerita TaxID=1973307 RepID=A0A8S0X130_CYCAE|nr:unnamed protein product [Cyclocybe aegerita]
MSLPPELIREVVTFIKDRASLGHSALTCRDLHAVAQKRLFASVTLDFTICFKNRYPMLGERRAPPRRTPTKFLALLRWAPHIRVYVTALQVNVGELPRSSAEEEDLHALFGLLTRLKSLGFPFIDEDLQILNRLPVFGHIPFLYHLSLEQKRNIEEFDFRAMSYHGGPNACLTLLDEFIGLKRLLIPPNLTPSTARTIPVQCLLESLTFDGMSSTDYSEAIPWLQDPTCLFDITNLKKLEVKTVDMLMTYNSVERLMGMCQNVEEFYLVASPKTHSTYKKDGDIVKHYNSIYHPPSLSSLPRLKALTIQGDWMTDLLSTISSYRQHHVVEVTIIVVFPVRLPETVLETVDWSSLAAGEYTDAGELDEGDG